MTRPSDYTVYTVAITAIEARTANGYLDLERALKVAQAVAAEAKPGEFIPYVWEVTVSKDFGRESETAEATAKSVSPGDQDEELEFQLKLILHHFGHSAMTLAKTGDADYFIPEAIQDIIALFEGSKEAKDAQIKVLRRHHLAVSNAIEPYISRDRIAPDGFHDRVWDAATAALNAMDAQGFGRESENPDAD